MLLWMFDAGNVAKVARVNNTHVFVDAMISRMMLPLRETKELETVGTDAPVEMDSPEYVQQVTINHTRNTVQLWFPHRSVALPDI